MGFVAFNLMCFILFIFYLLMILINWNCRGAQGKNFRRTLTNFCRKNKVDMVALQETQCSGNIAINTIKKLGFKNHFLVEARDFSGGIWLMWNRMDIKIHLIKTDFHFLHVQVNEQNMDPWLLTVVYASPREHERADTWQQLRITKPWLMMGDFKEIASLDDKKGGAHLDISKCQKFNCWINDR
jgi:exonuclease III